MSTLIKPIIERFSANVKTAYNLADFDEVVLKYAIISLQNLDSRLRKQHKFENPRLLVTQTIDHLKKIRQNDSLKSHYQHIFNQCIVLLVSYFSSAVSDIFEHSVTKVLTKSPVQNLLKEELRLTLEELIEHDFNLSGQIGHILASKKDISFQDMQSIHRAFKNYLGLEIEKGEVVNTIIFGQACRHVIVHDGAVVNSRLIKQISKANPRRLNRTVEEGEQLSFTPEEIHQLGGAMIEYIERLAQKLEQQI